MDKKIVNAVIIFDSNATTCPMINMEHNQGQLNTSYFTGMKNACVVRLINAPAICLYLAKT
jgi:hypothetical protein